jgi:carbon-monoxide dehydrogenase small subunit
VHRAGRRLACRACLALAVRADGARVARSRAGTDAALHPIQDAFVHHGAIQCGFCTPGMVITVKALLDEHPKPTDHEIREFLSGNFCRCAGYNLILNAVRDAAGLTRHDERDINVGRTA